MVSYGVYKCHFVAPFFQPWLEDFPMIFPKKKTWKIHGDVLSPAVGIGDHAIGDPKSTGESSVL